MLVMLVLASGAWKPELEVVAGNDVLSSAKRVALQRSLSSELTQALQRRNIDTSPKATALKEKNGLVMTELRPVPTLTVRVTVKTSTYACVATAVDQRVVWTKDVSGSFEGDALEIELRRCVETIVEAFSAR